MTFTNFRRFMSKRRAAEHDQAEELPRAKKRIRPESVIEKFSNMVPSKLSFKVIDGRRFIVQPQPIIRITNFYRYTSLGPLLVGVWELRKRLVCVLNYFLILSSSV
jgi:hypothetical protein